MRRREFVTDSIPMRVATLAIDPVTTLPIVVLEDQAGIASAYVRVGANDASAIAAELEEIELLRPTTHRLMGKLLERAGARIAAVELRANEDGARFGVIHVIASDGRRVREEARSSDAIALALRAKAAIYVAPSVIDRGSLDEELPREISRAALSPRDDEPLELAAAPAEAFGKWRM